MRKVEEISLELLFIIACKAEDEEGGGDKLRIAC
jgi:hypothetical protein